MKKTIITIFLFFAIYPNAFAQKLNITINKIKDNGIIHIGIYDSKKGFETDRGEKGGKTDKVQLGIIKKITNEKSTQTFTIDVKPGVYAIGIFYDLNDNNKLDTNLFGIPKEPYAFSNNVFGKFGPPKFEKASFKVRKNSPTNLSIDLKN